MAHFRTGARAPILALSLGVGLVLALLAVAAPQGGASDGFLPHGICYTWNPALIRLHVASDTLIGLAYFSIPLTLAYFIRRREDLPFGWIFVLFALFIVACGATHLFEVWTLWNPAYWLSGAVKALTAAVSLVTAVALVMLMPRALAIPSAAALRSAKTALEAEVAERKRAEVALVEARDRLEERVEERTRALAAANEAAVREREWLQVTLSSIGDAVIATGPEGHVQFMNGVAEGMTGWTVADARERPLDDVFRIIDEQQRAPAANPALVALREGRVVGLSNHTLLVDRAGREWPIDDSAAPILDGAGRTIGAVLVFRDITERRRAESQREQLTRDVVAANELLDTVFNQAPVGLGLWDRQLRFVRLNAALAQMNGLPVEAHLGKTVAEVLPQVGGDVMHAFQRVMDTGEPVLDMEASGMTPAAPGLTRHWRVSYYPVRLGGEAVGVGAVCQEVTAEREAAAERLRLLAVAETARAEAEEASRLKDEFLAMVSHELRTPLHAIVGWVHVLQHANPAPEVATQALARIAASVGAQSRLIEDLLDVSRVVSGKLTLAREPVDPDPLVRTAVESMRAAAEQAGIDLHADVALDGAMVEGDAGRLQQVLANVLSNAVKFTPRGGRVRVDARRAAGAVEISVSDTGEGIGAAFLPHVFERFRQEDGGPGGRRGGLGLGLSIARHVCELHGGSIEASSAGKGQGATFRLRLPLMAGDAAVATPGTQTPLGGTPLTGLRVLLVEDDADARTALAHAMRAAGAEVLEAADGAAALAAARAQPEVLVSDLGLPDTDGHSLMRRLRESVPSLVHAIAVTAFRPPRTRDPDRFGFAAYIQKPIEPRTIIAALARWRDGRDGS